MILNGLESLKWSLQQPSLFTRPCPSDVLFLYLAVLAHAIIEVVKKILNAQKLIYCVGQLLKGAKTWYRLANKHLIGTQILVL